MKPSASLSEFQTTNWICWLLFACVCLVEARYNFRRPPLPPPQPPKLMAWPKKSWPIAPRISVGNTVHVHGNLQPKRMLPKPPNYRIRRPPMFNVPPTIWKNQLNQMAIRAPLNNHAVLPQRPPVKEFHSQSSNKIANMEFSPEYRPEAAVLPPTHRGGVDDDKGPIHTIPAPNLSPLDRPFGGEANAEDAVQRQQTTADAAYKLNPHGLSNFEFGSGIGTSLATQRPVTSATPPQSQYEVTETDEVNQKEYQTIMPTFLPPEFATLSTLVNPDLQTNDVYFNNHPASNIGLIGTNVQLGQQNLPLQTNLHSSMHVGFPGTAGQTPYVINQQIPDLHVGHPAPAGPPLSATQLYDLLNSFPQKIPEQYQSGQQPQLQQHILQQQLGQFFQPGMTGFSQPQMQSFNYDEQDNKEQQQQQQQQQQQHQQQQVVFDQEYAGRVNTNYNVDAADQEDEEAAAGLQQNEDLAYIADEQLENNIDYDQANDQKDQSTYFDKVVNDDGMSTQFYTTLPNREAAEKLAALAAAGNVNSQLIGQLRKQQQRQQQQQQQENEDAMPPNHKNEDQGNYYRRSQQEQQKEFNRQRQEYSDKRPLRIMVPDETDDYEPQNDEAKENGETEYEYENDEPDAGGSRSENNEFGTRLSPKTT
ncbi:myb-like protein Q [Ceratina calcarata]|uniref:Myb-like protein Q n=1 Tax=Ceratina calcarata TaxID=156304 RepID=A0AAJ7S0U9_9HYME|nr:myb-like protein Q [Ceratina calcarata]